MIQTVSNLIAEEANLVGKKADALAEAKRCGYAGAGKLEESLVDSVSNVVNLALLLSGEFYQKAVNKGEAKENNKD